jgi:hypothetical protein
MKFNPHERSELHSRRADPVTGKATSGRTRRLDAGYFLCPFTRREAP